MVQIQSVGKDWIKFHSKKANWWQRVDLNYRPRAYEATNFTAKMLNNPGVVSRISELSKLSKSYISQVKSGKRPPSKKLLEILADFQASRVSDASNDYFTLFMQSREAMGVTSGTLYFYRMKLGKFLNSVSADHAERKDIEKFLIQFKNLGNRHAYYRAIRTFYYWREEFDSLPNPMRHMRAPRMPKLVLPSLSAEEVSWLLKSFDTVGHESGDSQLRNQAIIALFVESGLRLSELTSR